MRMLVRGCLTIAVLLFACGCATTPAPDQNLFYASQHNNIPAMERAIRQGANVDALIGGQTALQLASKHKKPEAAELLIDEGADVNLRSTKGLTPLHYAALHGSIRVATLLIENGADLNIRTLSGQKAIDLARQRAYRPMIQLLNEASKRPPSLIEETEEDEEDDAEE